MPRWLSSLAVYRDRRVLPLGPLGFSSGLPLSLTASTLTVRLAESGVDVAAIGLFASVGLPYNLKFAWAPLIDRVPVPVLSKRLGQRRAWLLVTQVGLAAALVVLGLADPRSNAWQTAAAAVLVAFWSASQDIMIDAFRVERLPPDLQGAGAGLYSLGYRLGMLVAGAGALYLASARSWAEVYAAMAALMAVGLATTLLCAEPERFVPRTTFEPGASLAARWVAWLRDAVVGPLKDFTRRPGWAGILAFLLLFKLGDSLAGVMTNPFLLALGFTKIEIANVVKTFGMVALLLGTVLGGALLARVGVQKGLWIGGVLQLVSNGMFAVQAAVGHDLWMLGATIGFENLATGMGAAALVAYLGSLCHREFTATQFALLSSVAAMSRTWLSSSAGVGAKALGWGPFFLATMVAAVPGLLLLWWLQRRFVRQEASHLAPLQANA